MKAKGKGPGKELEVRAKEGNFRNTYLVILAINDN